MISDPLLTGLFFLLKFQKRNYIKQIKAPMIELHQVKKLTAINVAFTR